MYVNKIPFMNITSCAIHFRTAEMIKKKKIYHHYMNQTNN